ncbi:leucine-rich repeat domain-containing protein [Saccharibacillus brassicae]|uniref:Leucine-rich repeat domain-containing protein n=1 Tax=Saccharibacillus brassicae TaxID=2583377 RepID=A0A4Y6URZ8_SACBS|nr:leucine-rich repeat domain-containing protein [Saccharibacillus brassicae]QDH20409.1 leucine-rich repeat domain-containing protein [Saccharibacillus brassicae]
MLIYNDPKGEAYRKLIDYMSARAATFSLKGPRILKVKDPRDPPLPEWSILEQIQPYFAHEEVYHCENGYEDDEGIYQDCSYDDLFWHYRCCRETADFLKATTSHLFGWIHPELPEDLCFWDDDGNCLMHSMSHEDIAGMNATPEEAERLYHEIPGVFLIPHTPFRDPLQMLELTRHHRHDQLELMGPGAAEALERVDELPWLRTLEVHDETLEYLPDALFEVERLRSLILCMRNLNSIPAGIGRLRNLRGLEISNVPLLPDGVRSHKSTGCPPAWKLIPKEQLALRSLPPEIGQLKRLRSLSIHYTGLRELPAEFADLRNLRTLNLSDNLLIDERPELLRSMPKLKSVYTVRDSGIYSGPYSSHYFD